MMRARRSGQDQPWPMHPLLIFALIFTTTFLLHASVLRLPYFWDEAGYFIPAAYDFYNTGDLIPHTTLSNAHPPLLMVVLAAWWKLNHFTPIATRTVMLLITAVGLLGLFRLSQRVANLPVAIATVALTALYPVFFAQSSLAHLDVLVFALTMWTLNFYFAGRLWQSIACAALACLAKETAVVTPLTLFAWELASNLAHRFRPEFARRWCGPKRHNLRPFGWLLALVPLVLWFAYHYHRQGFLFGNPEYLRYNVAATLSPLRIFIAFLMRIWHAFGYMNLFVLTGATYLAMRAPAIVDQKGERQRIAIPVQVLLGLVLLAHMVEFAVLGGAVLARYLMPVIPFVVLVCVSTLRRRIDHWKLWCVTVGIAFIFALVINPPWRISPEDNLAYSDFVRLHRSAANYVSRHYADDRILTAWPASDELNRPFLGYVRTPLTVIHLENFTAREIARAAQQRENYDVVVAFNTKYEPPANIFNRIGWWNRLQERFFDYHSDLRPPEIAHLLGGQIAWQQSSGGQWIAVIELDKARNARLTPRFQH